MAVWKGGGSDLAPKNGKKENAAPIFNGEMQCSFGWLVSKILFSTKGNISKPVDVFRV